jgi:hypothetical protein
LPGRRLDTLMINDTTFEEKSRDLRGALVVLLCSRFSDIILHSTRQLNVTTIIRVGAKPPTPRKLSIAVTRLGALPR